MNIALISDTHGQLPPVSDFQGVDAIVHAGDVGPDRYRGSTDVLPWYATEFSGWAARLGCPIHMTWGNHDFVGQHQCAAVKAIVPQNVHIHSDNSVVIGGKEWYFTPWSNLFGSWAFMAPEEQLAQHYANIPLSTQMLVSHGPPKFHGDRIFWDGDNQYVGSVSLAERMRQLPQLERVICGHIHEARGLYGFEDTSILVHNVAILDARYRLVHKPVVIVV